MKLTDIKTGDTLIADTGFTCIKGGTILTVQTDKDGTLFVPCSEGQHGLEGQTNDKGELVGLAPYLRDGQPLLDPRSTIELMADRDGN